MDILKDILENKRREVRESRELYPVKLLEKSIYYQASPVSLKKYILRPDMTGIIAEFKRRSPSRGMINEFADPAKVCIGYMQAGVSALSVLTDKVFFGGTKKDLEAARGNNYCPILRKDFIIDAYQVIESRSIGADAILLIAGVLKADELKELSDLAHSLGMEVLFEVHRPEEVDLLPPEAAIIGVNSRNLGNFSVSMEATARMAGMLPGSVVRVAESGIDSPETLLELRRSGYHGFLIGEHFMREGHPANAAKQFIRKLKILERCR